MNATILGTQFGNSIKNGTCGSLENLFSDIFPVYIQKLSFDVWVVWNYDTTGASFQSLRPRNGRSVLVGDYATSFLRESCIIVAEIQSLISFLLALFSGSIAPTFFEFLLRLLAHAFAKEKDDSGLVAVYIYIYVEIPRRSYRYLGSFFRLFFKKKHDVTTV